MGARVLVTLAPGAAVREEGEHDLRLCGPLGGHAVRRPSPEIRAALAALAAGGVTEAALVAMAGADAAALFFHLAAGAAAGAVAWTVSFGAAKLATLAAVSPHFVEGPTGLDEDRAYRLSRFAYVRARDDGVLLLECPLSHACVVLHDRRAALLALDLSRPAPPPAIAASAGDLDPAAVRAILGLLAGAGMLEVAPDPTESPSPAAVARAQWEFHDLLFHVQSRGPRNDRRAGGTYRFEGKIEPLPLHRPPSGGPVAPLHRPDLEALRRTDTPFTEVLERRRTVRAGGRAPITARELGELLFRSARERGERATPRGELGDRPYPAAGALHELELYPVVRSCDGLVAGVYHYRPREHLLEQIDGDTPELRALLEAARDPELPDVLVVITARFARVSWKYESIAYALVLKDVGVLMQTIYLVATAMGLGPRAIGNGDPDLFCRVLREDACVEGSVGEMALVGSPAQGGTDHDR